MTGKKEIAVVQQNNSLPALRPDQREHLVAPPVDVYEANDSYVLLMDLPGAAKESINVGMENGSLVVKAATEPLHKSGATLLFGELGTPVFYRSFTLGDGVDRNTVDARFEQGVLTLTLFKKEELKPREITIR